MGNNELSTVNKNTNEQHTSKKVKIIGSERFVNVETGELEEFQVTSIEERDFNFSKVWMRNFISTLDLVGNQKTRLALWVIDNVNKENQLISTLRGMSDETGISLETVRTTMKILQEANFLKKSGNGVYTVNPDIVFKGNRNARLNVLNQYQELGTNRPKLTDDEKIEQLKNSISVLQRELNKLTKKQDVIDAEIEPQLSFDPQTGEIFEKARMVNEKQKTNPNT